MHTAHVGYSRHLLAELKYSSAPYSMSLAFFALSSLDLLGALASITPAEKAGYVEWIYAQQHPQGGFRGSPFIGLAHEVAEPAHIVMTYTALLNLAILGDDLARLDVRALLSFVTSCQSQDGSFAPFPGSTERDVRFVYCAFVLCSLFDRFDGIDVERAVGYLLRCQSYDGAFGQMPGLEPQGGTTYCTLASLRLCGQMYKLPSLHGTIDWLVHRIVPLDPELLDPEDLSCESDPNGEPLLVSVENGDLPVAGFQGRPEKSPDACYSFWVGASLQSIGPNAPKSLRDPEAEKRFLLLCQSKMGGIAKFPGDYPDIYHTYLALAALSLSRAQVGLARLDPAINLSKRSLEHLKTRIKAHQSKP